MKFLWGILILQAFTAGDLIRSASSEYRVWDNNEINKSNGRVRQQPGWPTGLNCQPNLGASNTDEVTFFYYPANWLGIRELTIETDNLHDLSRANLSQKFPHIFIIPGFFQSCESDFAKRMIAAYRLRMGNAPNIHQCQIFCVDWRRLSGIMRSGKVLDYFKSCAGLEADALKNAPKVVDLTVKFIQFLMAQHKIRSIEDIHIIGFGVGSHIAGHIGHALRKMNTENEYLGRITALDPPKLIPFGSISAQQLKKLERSDAFFVGVYHTDVNNHGTNELLGDIDFFPNGGGAEQKYQPVYKCVKLDSDLPLIGGLLNRFVNLDFVKNNIHCRGQYTSEANCNHNLAYVFYAMSIVGEQISAYQCPSYDDLVNNNCKKSEAKRTPFGEFNYWEDGVKKLLGKYYLKITPQRKYHGLVFYGEIDK